MIELKDQPRCFCTLGFRINSLVDKGKFMSMPEFYKLAEGHKIMDWLDKNIDMSLWDQEDKLIMDAEFESFANVIDPTRHFGVENNGLTLLVAACFEYIQNPPTRTIKDL